MTELLTLFSAKREEIGTSALAKALDISSAAVRMICTGHYPNPDKVLTKFAAHYIDVVACSYTDEVIQRDECRSRSAGPKPFGGHSKIRWWQHCQNCPHKGGK